MIKYIYSSFLVYNFNNYLKYNFYIHFWWWRIKKILDCNYYEWKNTNMFHDFTLDDWWEKVIRETLYLFIYVTKI